MEDMHDDVMKKVQCKVLPYLIVHKVILCTIRIRVIGDAAREEQTLACAKVKVMCPRTQPSLNVQ